MGGCISTKPKHGIQIIRITAATQNSSAIHNDHQQTKQTTQTIEVPTQQEHEIPTLLSISISKHDARETVENAPNNGMLTTQEEQTGERRQTSKNALNSSYLNSNTSTIHSVHMSNSQEVSRNGFLARIGHGLPSSLNTSIGGVHHRSGASLYAYDHKSCILVLSILSICKCEQKVSTEIFAATVARMRQIVFTAVSKYHPLSVETMNEMFLIIFENCDDGVKYSIELMQLLTAYNALLNEPSMRLRLSGIGIDFGDVMQDFPGGQLFGVAADCAYMLCKNVASNQVLCSNRVKREIMASEMALDLEFERFESQAADFPDALQGHYFQLKWKHSNESLSFPDYQDSTFIGHQLLALTRLYDPNLDSASAVQVLADIKNSFVKEATVVLKFCLCIQKVTANQGTLHAFACKHNALLVIQPYVKHFNGFFIEETSVIFPSIAHAIKAAVYMKFALARYNEEMALAERMEVNGFGIHIGELLVIPESGVFCGYPVCVSNELAANIAHCGEIFISEQAYLKIQHMQDLYDLSYKLYTPQGSGIPLHFYRIEGTLPPLNVADPAANFNLYPSLTASTHSPRYLRALPPHGIDTSSHSNSSQGRSGQSFLKTSHAAG